MEVVFDLTVNQVEAIKRLRLRSEKLHLEN